MRSWSRTFVAAAGAFALAAAACSGGSDLDQGSGSPAAQSGSTTADLSGQEIEVAAVWTSAEQRRFTEVLSGFEEQTGATVKYTSTGDDIAAVIGPRIEGGDPPDVAVLPQPGLLRDYADQGVLQPIEDAAGDEVDENFGAGARDVGTVDDTLYAVYFRAAQKSTVWYNVNVFKDAGVEPPATWEDLKAAAQTISDFGVTPFSFGGGDGWTLSDWFENIYIRTAGPEKYDQLAKHEIPWTDPSVKEALSTFAEILGDDSMIAGGVSGALQTDFNGSVTQVFADPQQPDAGIVFEGDFVAGIITGETPAKLGTDADFFDFPSINDSPPTVVAGGDLVVSMTDSEAGKALVEYLATPEAAEIWAGLGGFISPNLNVDPSVYTEDTTRRAAEALVAAGDEARYDLSDLQPAAFGATTGQGIWGLLQDFVRDPGDVDGVTQQLEAAASKAFK